MLEFLTPQKSPEEWQLLHRKMIESGWDDFTLERQGDLTAWLTRKHRDEYGEWNRLVRQFRPMVKNHVSRLSLNQAFSEDLAAFLEWDFLHVLLEGYYQRLNGAPLFYLKYVLPEYQHNRVPCAWEGDFPKGNLASI